MKAKRLLALGLSLALAATTVLASPGATGVVRAEEVAESGYTVGETEINEEPSTTLSEVENDVEIDGLYYTLYSDNTASVTGMVYDDVLMVVPEKISYNGTEYTVTCVGSNPKVSYSGYSRRSYMFRLVKVVLPGSITAIGDGAFSGCNNLVEINIPEKVTYIGEDAFYNCFSLGSITIPDGVTDIGDTAFWGCKKITELNLPSSITNIGRGIVYGCTSLKTITIPDGNEKYKAYDNVLFDEKYSSYEYDDDEESSYEKVLWAFPGGFEGNYTIPDGTDVVDKRSGLDQAEGLTELTIPASLKRICLYDDYENFNDCSNLTSFSVMKSEGSDTNAGGYYSENGVLFNKDGGIVTLMSYPANKADTSYIIPDAVTNLASRAFENAGNLTSVSLNKITALSDCCFAGCDSLTTINGLATVKSIDNSAFCDCVSLQSADISGLEVEIKSEEDGQVYSYSGFNGIGPDVFRGCESLTTVKLSPSMTAIPDEMFSDCSALTNVEGLDKATYIGQEAFSNCDKLSSVNLSNVKYVDSYAYEYCDGLTSVSIPSTCYMSFGVFSYCKNLKSAEFTGTITEIPQSVFSGCSALETVKIPDGVTRIGGWAFNGCSNLTSFPSVPDSVLYVENNAFSGVKALKSVDLSKFSYLGDYAFSATGITSVNISKDITRSGEKSDEYGNDKVEYPSGLFQSCSDLTDVTIASGVTHINDSTFRYCDKISKVTIPETVTEIGSSAFNGCYALAEVNIPSAVTTIGNQTFFNCNKVTKFAIPVSVKSIGYGAFSGCDSLASVELASGVTGYTVDGGVLYNADKSILYCYPGGLTNATFTIPDSVKEISRYAFAGDKKLTSVTVPESVKTIGRYAFSHMNALTSFALPTGINRVSEYVVNDCDNLTSLTIPDTVTVIGEYAFIDNDALTSVTIPDSVLDIGNGAFQENSNLNSIVWSKNLLCIDNYAFAGAKVDKATVPASVLYVGEYAFDYGKSNGNTNVTPGNTPGSSDGNTDVTSGGAINPSGSGGSGGGGGGGGGASAGTTTTQKNADGSTTTTNVVKTASGTTTTESTTYTDGSKKVVKTVESTDGSKKVTQTNTKKDGSKTVAEISVSAAGKGTVTTTVTDASGKETGKATYSVSGKKLTLKSMEGGKSIVVPATVTIGGTKYKVTKIAAGAMKGNATMTKVQIGKNVTSIGKNAFSGDKKLKTIVIKGKVTSVGKNAFKGIAKKAVIKVSATKKNFTKIKKAIKKSGIAKTVTIKRTK